jgi:thioredoxin-like negative regulator of GroEL
MKIAIDFLKSNMYIIIIVCVLLVSAVYSCSSKKLILFYSDQCGHCTAFKPEWELIKASGLAATVEHNCGENSSVCSSYGIQGYPTILVECGFSKHEYSGPRTLDSIINFYNGI